MLQEELQRFTLNHEQAFVTGTVLPCLLPRLKTNMSTSHHRNDGHARG